MRLHIYKYLHETAGVQIQEYTYICTYIRIFVVIHTVQFVQVSQPCVAYMYACTRLMIYLCS